MYKAIIFDLFDVIHTDDFKAWLKRHGYRNKGEFAKSSFLIDRGYINNEDFLMRISAISGIAIKDIKLEFDKFAKLDNDIVKLITFLQNRYKIGLLTNGGSDFIRPILQRYNIEPLFDQVVISSEVGISKPDPAIFHLMLKKLTIDPVDTIFIDDNENNIEAAKSLGVYGIWYQNIKILGEELRRLDIVID